MGNELTTLMQIVIEEMNCKLSGFRPHWSAYLNDDAAAIFFNWRQADYYRAVAKNTCKKLGLAFKDKASFLSIGQCVICEIYACPYNKRLNDKSTFDFMSISFLFKAINASHARHNFMSYVPNSVPDRIISDLINYWGYILSKDEFHFISRWGGWNPARQDGLITEFDRYNYSYETSRIETAMINAYHSTELTIKPWQKVKNYKQKVSLFFDDTFNVLCKFDKPLNFSNMFRPSADIEENVRAWHSFQRILKKNFFNKLKEPYKPLNMGHLFILLSKEYPQKDVIPPFGLHTERYVISKTVRYDSYRLGIKNPYENVRTSILYDLYLKRGPTSINYIVERTGNNDISNAVITANDRERLDKRFGDPVGLFDTDLSKRYKTFAIPPDNWLDYWHNPFRVLQYCERAGYKWSAIIPIGKIAEKRALLDLRKEYLGELTSEEWIEFGLLDRDVIPFFAAYYNEWRFNEAIFENLYNLFCEKPWLASCLKVNMPPTELISTIKKLIVEVHFTKKRGSTTFEDTDYGELLDIQEIRRELHDAGQIETATEEKREEEEPPIEVFVYTDLDESDDNELPNFLEEDD
jgi:hypothetical protein